MNVHRFAVLIGMLGVLVGACGTSRGKEGGPCRSDGTCDEGLICAHDVCVEIFECNDHSDCPDGYYCDPVYSNCIKGCRGDYECADDEVCIFGTCYDRNTDDDMDGYTIMDDCDDTDPEIHPGAEEHCNGEDDDCDGAVDDNLSAPDADNQYGVCIGSLKVCDGENGWTEPDYTEIPGYEETEFTCDGEDNDCDGQIDNDLPAPHAAKQAGVCNGAKQECSGGRWMEPDYTEIAGYESSEESCDGLDNDCDGDTDENLTGPPAANQLGVCFGSRQTCAGAAGFVEPDYSSIPGYEAVEASCDGKDNDCDDLVDEDLTPPDSSKQDGVCAGSKATCGGSAGWRDPDFTQIPDYMPSEYSNCDGLDNDCDGEIDDGYDQDGDGFYDKTNPDCVATHGPRGRIDCDDSIAYYNETCIVHVDQTAVGGLGDGSSWADAFLNLQDALAFAKADYEVWVAEGVYTPDIGFGHTPGDRSDSFPLKSGIPVYGGFTGVETDLEQRNWIQNQTVLSGDLNGDDGPGFANTAENSYHVVMGASGGILDGFTVSGGNADGTESTGGGMFNSQDSPVIENCAFSDNQAADNGGAIYNYWSSAPVIINTAFVGNSAGGNGGGIYNYWGSSPSLFGCLFNGNAAVGSGGGMYTEWSGEPMVINSTFAHNSAGGTGGGMQLVRSSTTAVTNCVLYGNTPDQLGGSTYTATYTCIQGGFIGSGIIDLPADPFIDSDGADDVPGNHDDDLHLQNGSACIDSGSNAAVPADVTTDLDGNPRVVNSTVDRGAYEQQ